MTKEEMLAFAELLKPITEQLQALQKGQDSFKEDITSLKEDMSVVKDNVAEIKEDGKITRTAANKLLEWAEESGKLQDFPFPVEKKA